MLIDSRQSSKFFDLYQGVWASIYRRIGVKYFFKPVRNEVIYDNSTIFYDQNKMIIHKKYWMIIILYYHKK
jgi:hypothetical protein